MKCLRLYNSEELWVQKLATKDLDFEVTINMPLY